MTLWEVLIRRLDIDDRHAIQASLSFSEGREAINKAFQAVSYTIATGGSNPMNAMPQDDIGLSRDARRLLTRATERFFYDQHWRASGPFFDRPLQVLERPLPSQSYPRYADPYTDRDHSSSRRGSMNGGYSPYSATNGFSSNYYYGASAGGRSSPFYSGSYSDVYGSRSHQYDGGRGHRPQQHGPSSRGQGSIIGEVEEPDGSVSYTRSRYYNP